jgi:hypothetical protein
MTESMHASETEGPDVNERRLNPEDQAKVDAFLQSGVNSVERKPSLCDVVRGLTAHFPQGDVIQVV